MTSGRQKQIEIESVSRQSNDAVLLGEIEPAQASCSTMGSA